MGGTKSTLKAFDASKLVSKRILIVGGTQGIGKAWANGLASHGAQQVIIVGRREPSDLTQKYPSNVQFVKLDVSTIAACEKFANEFPEPETLDMVAFTNGIITASTREVTPDGVERDLMVSYLSRVIIARILISRGFGKKEGAKMFVMGYPGNNVLVDDITDLNCERHYKQFPAHMNTVAGNESLVLEMARKESQITTIGLNPGLIKTGIRENIIGTGWFGTAVEFLIGLFNIDTDTYASRTLLPLTTAEDLKSGSMFSQKGELIPASKDLTPEYVTSLMNASDDVITRAKSGKIVST